jgi:hypothetical protein
MEYYIKIQLLIQLLKEANVQVQTVGVIDPDLDRRLEETSLRVNELKVLAGDTFEALRVKEEEWYEEYMCEKIDLQCLLN